MVKDRITTFVDRIGSLAISSACQVIKKIRVTKTAKEILLQWTEELKSTETLDKPNKVLMPGRGSREKEEKERED